MICPWTQAPCRCPSGECEIDQARDEELDRLLGLVEPEEAA